MSINTREDANRYYQLVNELVDEYITKWKIRPSNLSRYLKPGSERFTKFLEKNKLREIKGAERVLRDVIEDRTHMEKDGVITFEKFNIMESAEWKVESLRNCLYKGIEKADIKAEKVLADAFDTNLGSIDIVDPDKHVFKINDWEGKDVTVVIYSEEELEVIKYNILDFLYDDFISKTIELPGDIKLTLSGVVDRDMWENRVSKQLNDNFIQIISDALSNGFSYHSKNETGDSVYFIWVSGIM
jgi:hypothetical protein